MNSFQQFYIQSYKNIFVGASILQKKIFLFKHFVELARVLQLFGRKMLYIVVSGYVMMLYICYGFGLKFISFGMNDWNDIDFCIVINLFLNPFFCALIKKKYFCCES